MLTLHPITTTPLAPPTRREPDELSGVPDSPHALVGTKGRRPSVSPTGSSRRAEAIAWVARQLDWEHRLHDLHAQEGERQDGSIT
jgi:hypothetical protein